MRLDTVFVLYFLTTKVVSTQKNLKIGAIFDTINPYNEIALKDAVSRLNSKYSDTLQIEAIIKHLPSDNPLEAMKTTCSLMEEGIVGILGPFLEHNSRVVQSICDDKDVPLLDVRWFDEPGDAIINFYPSQDLLTQLYIDVVTNWDYKDIVILYENRDSLKRMSRFLDSYDRRGYKIVLRQLDKSGDYRPVLKELKKSQVAYFIVDCSTDILRDVLVQIQQVGLMNEKYSFFVTNIDLHSLDLVSFQYSDANITGLQIFSPYNEDIEQLAQILFQNEIQENPDFSFSAGFRLQMEQVLIIDAFMMFGEVLSELHHLEVTALNCNKDDHWSIGSTITNLIKGKEYFGLSGGITFDVKGRRNNLIVDIIEVKEGGIVKVGNWSDDMARPKLIINRTHEEVFDSKKSLRDQSFVVVISLLEPFARLKKSSMSLYGNDEYEGYAIDLIHELSVIEGFNYSFLNQVDKQNDKMIKAVIDEKIPFGIKPSKFTRLKKATAQFGVIQRAHLAIGDLTITTERQQVVDFTTPFMNLGISIMYQKPKKAPPGFFQFADPFALEVWIYVALSYFSVSMVLYILGRICASEWINPYPCIEEPEFLVNQLSLRNCFWFVSGSIMQQGTEIGPLALSTRMVAGVWWFFTLIMVSSYTANLAAFLTRETPIPHFTDVNTLVQNYGTKDIKWGAKRLGATELFFNKNRDIVPIYGVIYDKMQEWGERVLVNDTKDGVEKSESENYAFFMESVSLEFEIQRRCNLMRVGPLLDEKSYGIALRKNSSYRGILNKAILDLQHSGKLNELKRKWWEENQGGGFCENKDEGGAATALNLKNVGGVFWVTIGGTVIAIGLVVAELALHVIKVSFQTKTPIKQSLIEEFKFYFKFSTMIKPVIYNNTSLESDSKDS